MVHIIHDYEHSMYVVIPAGYINIYVPYTIQINLLFIWT